MVNVCSRLFLLIRKANQVLLMNTATIPFFTEPLSQIP